MAASITDLLTQATLSSRPQPTQVASIRAAAGTTLTCNALTGWPTGTAVHFITYKIDTSGNKVAGTQLDLKGVVSGVTITQIQVKAGTDGGNAIGDIVEAAPTAAWANDVVSWGVVGHSQAGAHQVSSNFDPVNPTLETQKWAGVSAAVNEVTLTNATTGNNPIISATGDDTNISLSLTGKGTGGVVMKVPYKFSAYRNSALNATSTPSAIVFDTSVFDTGSNYSTSTGRFTAPIAGFYQFSATAEIINAGGGAHRGYIALFKNGTEFVRGLDTNYPSAGSDVFTVSVNPPLMQLAATDFVQVFIFASGTLALNVGSTPIYTYFGGGISST